MTQSENVFQAVFYLFLAALFLIFFYVTPGANLIEPYSGNLTYGSCLAQNGIWINDTMGNFRCLNKAYLIEGK